VDMGSMADASAAEIFSVIKTSAAKPPQVKKKEKQQMKHRAFLERLQSSQSPYSQSHNRRLKRKEKQQLAAKMDDLNTVLKDLESGVPEESKDIPGVTSSRKREDGAGTDTTSSVKRIGEGKGATLSTAQRKRVLKTEKDRISVIQATKEYAENPFELIRRHAQATLEPHIRPTMTKAST